MVTVYQLRRLWNQGPGAKRAAYGAFLESNPELKAKSQAIQYGVSKKTKDQARLIWKPQTKSVLPKNSETKMVNRSGTPGMFSGTLIGKKHISSRQVRQKYNLRGCTHVAETRGVVSDADMLGIGHQAFQFDGVVRVIFGAIMRKLLAKAGVTVDSTTREIDWTSPGISSGFRVYWNVIDGTGALLERVYAVPDNSSINSLFSTIAFTLKADLESMMTSSTGVKIQKIWLYSFYVIDSVTQTRVASMLDMNTEYLELTCSVTTGVQNRTPSVEGSALVDTVSTQPIKGPVFEFSGIPKTKMSQLQALNSVYDKGVILFRQSQISDVWAQGLLEVPVRSQFQNVVKSSYCRLAVSALKNFSISKTWKGNFVSLLQKWRCIVEGVTPQNILYSQLPGSCQMVFFEEEINSGSSFKMVVGYETQHTIGAQLSTRGRSNMEGEVVFNLVDNVPA